LTGITVKASVKWIENVTFLAESESGHTVVMDGPESAGGRNIGIRPMELVLLGVGGCTSFDVISILQKARQDVTDCVAEIEAERADDVPSVFTRIHFHFVVTGNNLKEAQVKRAIDLSADKYCSASIMLGRGGVDITHDYEIRDNE
jgi:putative redox protein